MLKIEELLMPDVRKKLSGIAKALNMEEGELFLDENSSKKVLGTFLLDTVLELHDVLAQNEREVRKKKQAEGIAAAKARGVHLGRPSIQLPDNFAALKKQWEQGTLSIKDFAAQTGLKESTLYRRLREK
jgi:DNA invertase Pin-like site-specific DNA recombinase